MKEKPPPSFLLSDGTYTYFFSSLYDQQIQENVFLGDEFPFMEIRDFIGIFFPSDYR